MSGAAPHAQTAVVPHPTWNVLVLEDEPLMSALIQRYIQSLPAGERDRLKIGYLASGWDLIEADLSNVRAAVVDVLLPQVTGVDLIRHFRRRYPGMGFVPITGMATEPMKRSLREVLTGDERVLEKPLRREEFLDHFLKAFRRTELFSSQPPAASPSLLKEEGEELWTTAQPTNSGIIAVESRRKLPRRRAA
jgi:FixJ family two-component response regulator